MFLTSGTIRNGRVELDDNEVPDGTTVVVLIPESDGTFEIGPAEKAKLVAAIDAIRKKTRR